MNIKMPIQKREGFTLVELLVVITIIAILMGALLPAVGAVRNMARNHTCRTRLDQIGIAILSYETGENHLPLGLELTNKKKVKQRELGTPSTPYSGTTAFVHLLLYLEEKAAYDDYQFGTDRQTINNYAPENQKTVSTNVAIFQCPSDGNAGLEWHREDNSNQSFSRSNYALCFGTGFLLGPRGTSNDTGETDGPFRAGSEKSARKISDLQDGTSHTILASEIMAGRVDQGPNADSRGVWAYHNAGSAVYMHRATPNAISTPDALPKGYFDNTFDKMPCRAAGSLYAQTAAARSQHAKNVNVVFADGHVDPISNKIDLEVWRALATIEGPRDEPSYDP